MKQYISREQFEELSEENQSKLYKYGELRGWDDHLPYFTIGQMIQFLEEHGELGQIYHLLNWTGETCMWRITNKVGIPTNNMGNPDFIELCDALWEAVKRKVENII